MNFVSKRVNRWGPKLMGLPACVSGPVFGMILALSMSVPNASGRLILESLTCELTENEVNGFKEAVDDIVIPTTVQYRNAWVYGRHGKNMHAISRMYEVTGDIDLLDRLIQYADACLYLRNDYAPALIGGQDLHGWTNKLEPLWPSNLDGEDLGGGVEQGKAIARICNAARLILSNPSLWDETVPVGDSYGFGGTYKERALTYILASDHVIDNWIMPHFVRNDEHYRYYVPNDPDYYRRANTACPWNQAMMLNDGIFRLAQCHELLGDDPDRVALYDEIVQNNVDFYFSRTYKTTSSVGSTCLQWGYSIAQSHNIDDVGHVAFTCGTLANLYESNRYAISDSLMLQFANTFYDIVLLTIVDGFFANWIDGTGAGSDYIREQFILLTEESRPDQYEKAVETSIDSGKFYSDIPIAASVLWVKHVRSKVSLFGDVGYSGWNAKISEGKYTLSELDTLGVVGGDTSSVRVPYGYELVVYAEDDFKGASEIITGGIENLEQIGMDDAVFSLEVVNVLCNLENVARNGTASQSSIDYGGLASRAIDGDINGVWGGGSVTHTSAEDQPWWRVDLGKSYAIDEVKIWGRTDGDFGARLSDYDVSIYDDDLLVWTEHRVDFPSPSISMDTGGLSGRYVEVRLRGSEHPLSLAEVQVFAKELHDPESIVADLKLIRIGSDGQLYFRMSGTIGEEYYLERIDGLGGDSSWEIVREIESLETSPLELATKQDQGEGFYRLRWSMGD